MVKYLSILRGINVSGKKKILMDDLKSLYEELGFTNVTTYIQSGNVIFEAENNEQPNSVQLKIENAISKKYNFDVPVIIRTKKELENIFRKNPFFEEKEIITEKLYVTFLSEEPKKENIVKLSIINYQPDKFELKGKNVFVYCLGKYGKTKLSNNFFEKKLKVSASTRNWKTIGKLYEIIQN